MSVFETLVAAATTKAGAAVAGLTLAAGTAGAAGVLPDLPSALDQAPPEEAVFEEQDDEAGTAELPEEADDPAEPADTDDRGVADEVHAELSGDPQVGPGHEDFGQDVAENAREGGSAFGQSVAEAASDGRSSDGAENGEGGQEAADAGAANADDRADDGEANADAGDEYRPEGPPEDAGAPDGAGPPEDRPEQAN